MRVTKNIQILLSTYNGEKYLRDQLDSFVSLDNFEDIKVIIRDDGSTDGTVSILNEYAEKYGFEILPGENIGFNASMHELALKCDMECEYFSFADQDDVWLPEKIKRGIDVLKDAKGPMLYSARSTLVDEDLKPFGKTLAPKKPLTVFNAMIQNVCIGHTQICNRALMEIYRREYSDDIFVNDWWMYLIATCAGTAVYDTECTTKYRQHSSNSVGYASGFFKNLYRRIRRFHTKRSVRTGRQIKAFGELYYDIISESDKKELDKFLSCQKNFFTRFGYIFKTKLYRQTGIENIIFRLMYLFGRYKPDSKKEISK